MSRIPQDSPHWQPDYDDDVLHLIDEPTFGRPRTSDEQDEDDR